MDSPVKKRLKDFLLQQNIKGTDFCKSIGVSSGFISGMRESIQPDKLESIALNYPLLNIGWLMTGIGEMLKREPVLSDHTPEDASKGDYLIKQLEEKILDNNKVIKLQDELIKSLRDQIELLKSNKKTIAPLDGGAMNADAEGFSDK